MLFSLHLCLATIVNKSLGIFTPHRHHTLECVCACNMNRTLLVWVPLFDFTSLDASFDGNLLSLVAIISHFTWFLVTTPAQYQLISPLTSSRSSTAQNGPSSPLKPSRLSCRMSLMAAVQIHIANRDGTNNCQIYIQCNKKESLISE